MKSLLKNAKSNSKKLPSSNTSSVEGSPSTKTSVAIDALITPRRKTSALPTFHLDLRKIASEEEEDRTEDDEIVPDKKITLLFPTLLGTLSTKCNDNSQKNDSQQRLASNFSPPSSPEIATKTSNNSISKVEQIMNEITVTSSKSHARRATNNDASQNKGLELVLRARDLVDDPHAFFICEALNRLDLLCALKQSHSNTAAILSMLIKNQQFDEESFGHLKSLAPREKQQWVEHLKQDLIFKFSKLLQWDTQLTHSYENNSYSWSQLQHLDLSNNQLTLQTLKILQNCDTLFHGTTPLHLNLEKNKLEGEAVGKEWYQILQHPHCRVYTLHLSHNLLGDECIGWLAKALFFQSNHSSTTPLRKLFLKQTNLSFVGVYALIQSAYCNSHIQAIGLDKNGLEEMYLMEMESICKRNRLQLFSSAASTSLWDQPILYDTMQMDSNTFFRLEREMLEMSCRIIQRENHYFNTMRTYYTDKIITTPSSITSPNSTSSHEYSAYVVPQQKNHPFSISCQGNVLEATSINNSSIPSFTWYQGKQYTISIPFTNDSVYYFGGGWFETKIYFVDLAPTKQFGSQCYVKLLPQHWNSSTIFESNGQYVLQITPTTFGSHIIEVHLGDSILFYLHTFVHAMPQPSLCCIIPPYYATNKRNSRAFASSPTISPQSGEWFYEKRRCIVNQTVELFVSCKEPNQNINWLKELATIKVKQWTVQNQQFVLQIVKDICFEVNAVSTSAMHSTSFSTQSIKFSIPNEGYFQLEVSLQEECINGCPFFFSCHEETWSEFCFATGPALVTHQMMSTVNETNSFLIQAMNTNGVCKLIGEDSFTVTVSLAATHQKSDPLLQHFISKVNDSIKVVDNKDGTYSVSLINLQHMSGSYKIHVEHVNNQNKRIPILDSPFFISIAQANELHSCELKMRQSQFYLNQSNALYLMAKDSHDLLIPQRQPNVVLKITNSNGQSVQVMSNNEKMVHFAPTLGVHVIHLQPTCMGYYHVAVENLKQSNPLQIKIEEETEAPCLTNCFVEHFPKEQSIVWRENLQLFFVVQLCNAKKSKLKHCGDDITVELWDMLHGYNCSKHIQVKPLQNGSYSLSWKVMLPTTYRLQILVNGKGFFQKNCCIFMSGKRAFFG